MVIEIVCSIGLNLIGRFHTNAVVYCMTKVKSELLQLRVMCATARTKGRRPKRLKWPFRTNHHTLFFCHAFNRCDHSRNKMEETHLSVFDILDKTQLYVPICVILIRLELLFNIYTLVCGEIVFYLKRKKVTLLASNIKLLVHAKQKKTRRTFSV